MLPEKPAAGCHPVVRIGGLLTTYVHICMYNYDTCMYLVIEGGGVRYRRSSHKFFFFQECASLRNYVFNEPINAMDWAASEATMGNIPTYRPCSVLSFAQN